MVEISRRRQPPHFVICDVFMRVVSGPHELPESLRDPQVLRDLKLPCREARHSNSIVCVALDDETVVRIMPLKGDLGESVAIFVDSFSRRGPVFKAAKTFGLTKRETEVLQHIVAARTNADIAKTLVVADSTVGDHVKSIMRKMQVSRRVEMVNRVYELELDSPDAFATEERPA